MHTIPALFPGYSTIMHDSCTVPGDRYWVFNANSLVTGFPKQGLPITEFGIPADVKRIDTVFTWGFNRRTYLVSGDMYWKLNENNTMVEYDYPRDMSIWRGVPLPLDAAFQYWDGQCPCAPSPAPPTPHNPHAALGIIY
ncbi:hypothetical protein ACOMHN_051788 [Nucella lapillus]